MVGRHTTRSARISLTNPRGNRFLAQWIWEATGFAAKKCGREVNELNAITERWGYWSDGCGELLPFCPECVRPSSRPTLAVPVKAEGPQWGPS